MNSTGNIFWLNGRKGAVFNVPKSTRREKKGESVIVLQNQKPEPQPGLREGGVKLSYPVGGGGGNKRREYSF